MQIHLVQQSFETVIPIADVAADMFYTRLFELDPSLRHLFRTDRQEQGRKLMSMLAVAVNGLSRLDQILPAVEQLGRRHTQYGVRDVHYATVAEALLWTLEKGTCRRVYTSSTHRLGGCLYAAGRRDAARRSQRAAYDCRGLMGRNSCGYRKFHSLLKSVDTCRANWRPSPAAAPLWKCSNAPSGSARSSARPGLFPIIGWY